MTMNRPALRAFAIWLLAMLAGAAIVVNSRFAADMSFFLPAKPTAEQQVLVDPIKEGVVSRLLMVGIAGGDSSQRGDGSGANTNSMRGSRLASSAPVAMPRTGSAPPSAGDHSCPVGRPFRSRCQRSSRRL